MFAPFASLNRGEGRQFFDFYASRCRQYSAFCWYAPARQLRGGRDARDKQAERGSVEAARGGRRRERERRELLHRSQDGLKSDQSQLESQTTGDLPDRQSHSRTTECSNELFLGVGVRPYRQRHRRKSLVRCASARLSSHWWRESRRQLLRSVARSQPPMPHPRRSELPRPSSPAAARQSSPARVPVG